MKFAIALIALVLAGCVQTPTAPKGLNGAPMWMKQPCPDLPDIPEKDGDPKVRTPHNIQIYQMYARCSLKQQGLAARDRNVSKK